MNKKITISLYGIIAIIIALFVGYIWGSSNVKELPASKTESITKWIKGDTIRDTISIKKLKPYKVTLPSKDIKIPSSTDTTKLFEVWKDYYTKRNYNLDFSNDTLGIFKVDAEVSENRLTKATSLIQPNIRTITTKETIYKVIKLQPYTVIGSSLDFRTNKIEIGLDFKQKYMLGVSGIRLDDKYGYTIDLGIKF